MLRLRNFSRETLVGRIGRHGSAASVSFLFLFFSLSFCNAEILIEPRIGFHGVFQLGRPFPLEVGLSNSGRPAEGTLEIVVWKGGGRGEWLRVRTLTQAEGWVESDAVGIL
jgi:hypothetical protein